MAARRLLIVMLVLLGISTLAAALVPPPERESTQTETTNSTATRAQEPRHGERVAAEVSASRRGRPERVRVSTGDQLALVVNAPRPAEVAIPAFGLIEFADRGAPARFDILIERSGRFDVTAERRGTVARIAAERRKRQRRSSTGRTSTVRDRSPRRTSNATARPILSASISR
jgi:hypothetical protein